MLRLIRQHSTPLQRLPNSGACYTSLAKYFPRATLSVIINSSLLQSASHSFSTNINASTSSSQPEQELCLENLPKRAKLSVGDIVAVDVLRLAFGGGGVAYHEGCTIMTPSVCVGDKVRVQITNVKKSFANAKLLEVLVPADTESKRTSPDQILRSDEPPICPYYERCGGCAYMHLSQTSQHNAKRNQVIDSLERIGRFRQDKPNSSLMKLQTLQSLTDENKSDKTEVLTPLSVSTLVTETVGSPKNYAFRSRIRAHTRTITNQISGVSTETVGMLARSDPSTLIPVPHCVIADPSLNLALAQYLSERQVDEQAGDRVSGEFLFPDQEDNDEDEIPSIGKKNKVRGDNMQVEKGFHEALSVYQDRIWSEDIFAGDMTSVSPAEFGLQCSEEEMDTFYASLSESIPSTDDVTVFQGKAVRGAKADGTARRSESFRTRVLRRMENAGVTLEDLIAEENLRTGSSFTIASAQDEAEQADEEVEANEAETQDMMSEKDSFSVLKGFPTDLTSTSFKKLTFGSSEMTTMMAQGAFDSDLPENADEVVSAYLAANKERGTEDIHIPVQYSESYEELSQSVQTRKKSAIYYQPVQEGGWNKVFKEKRTVSLSTLEESDGDDYSTTMVPKLTSSLRVVSYDIPSSDKGAYGSGSKKSSSFGFTNDFLDDDLAFENLSSTEVPQRNTNSTSTSLHPERYQYVDRYNQRKPQNQSPFRAEIGMHDATQDATSVEGGSGVVDPMKPSTYRALLMRSRFAQEEREALGEAEEKTTAGQLLLSLEKYGWFVVPPGCFFQTNMSILPRFISILRERIADASNAAASRNKGIRPPRHVIDAHCGVGFLSLALAVPQTVLRSSLSLSEDALTPQEIIGEMGYDYPNLDYPFAPMSGELIDLTDENALDAFTVDSYLGIEVNQRAVTAAGVNASRFLVDQKGSFVAGPVEEVLPKMRSFIKSGVAPQKENPLYWNPEFTTMLLDPPRSGLTQSTITTLLSMRSDQILYVSCDPTTMARDLALLCAESNLQDEKIRKTSYRLVSVTPIDMFPQTSSIEVVVDLRRV